MRHQMAAPGPDEHPMTAPQAQCAQATLARDEVCAEAMHAYSRTAVQACIDVVSWLAPDPGSRVTLRAGLDECAAMLRGTLGFEGFSVCGEGDEAGPLVFRSALRSVLPAALFAWIDHGETAGAVTIAAAPAPQGVRLTLTRSDAEGGSAMPAFRALEWEEVHALAQAEGVHIERGPHAVCLTFVAA